MRRIHLFQILAAAAMFIAATGNAYAKHGLVSYLPKTDLERFIVNNFDIASIRSSLGPRRQPGQFHFSDLGIRPTAISAEKIHLESDGWHYDITVLQRGDLNGDGIEDVAVCFVDDGHGAGGTYFSVQPLLLTRYSKNGPLIAISYEPDDKRCQAKPR